VLCDTLEHVRAGLAHHQGLATRGYLHRSGQAPGACREGTLGQQEGRSWAWHIQQQGPASEACFQVSVCC
jgi:hypothetical protein